MKRRKILQLLCIVVSCLVIPGCSNGENKHNKTSAMNDKVIKTKTEDYIQNAIDNASLIAGIGYMQNADGDIFTRYLPRAYSYYGKKIKLVRESVTDYVLAAMEDGSLYHNNTLISNEYKIKDILWKTNNVDIDAYLITEDGHVLLYDPSDKDFGEATKIYGYNSISECEGLENIVVGCRYRSSVIFLSEDGEAFGISFSNWDGCEIKDWKNAVVMACTQNEEDGTKSIAAIAGDGTVYATGDYSEDILSWEDLAYISMDEELIVGLKRDGTLEFAGTKADAFKNTTLTGVEAVRVFDENFIAMTNEGFYCAYIPDFDGEFSYINPEKPMNTYSYYVDTEGNIRECFGNNIWTESPDIPLIMDEATDLIYFQTMGIESILWGMDSSYVVCKTKDLSFQLLDINNDDINEILIYNGSGSHSDGYMGLGCIYNGEMRIILVSDYFLRYYPESGIIVTGRTNKGFLSEMYWSYSYSQGNIEKIAYIYTDCNSENPESTYFVNKDIEFENTDTNDDNNLEFREITETEFNALLKKYIGDEKQINIDEDRFVENTEENRKKIILADISNEKTDEK